MDYKNIGIKLLESVKEYLGMNNNEILKLIKNNIKEEMNSMGFSIRGNSFSRLTDDGIIQEMEFQRGSSGEEFTININIVPENKDIPYINRSLRLCQLIPEAPQWWNYSEKSVEEVNDIIKNKLIPIFINLSTLKGIFEFITQPDILQDYEKLITLRKNLSKNPSLYMNQINSFKMKSGLALLDRYGSNEAAQICEKLNKKDLAQKIQHID
jgi:hypothetical protein